MALVKLKLVVGDNYNLNHPDHGWGKIRKGNVFSIEANYARNLLKVGEQVRDDLFVASFKLVSGTIPDEDGSASFVEVDTFVDADDDLEGTESEDTPEKVKEVPVVKEPTPKKRATRSKNKATPKK